MNNPKKAWLFACSLLIASASSADTNEMVKQVKEWGSDLEHRLQESENRNVSLQKQLDKASAELKSTDAERDSLKTELTESKKALTTATKEAKVASRRAEKAERQLTRQSDKADRNAVRQEKNKMSIAVPKVAPTVKKMDTNSVVATEKMAEPIPAIATMPTEAIEVVVIPAVNDVQTAVLTGELTEPVTVAPAVEVMSDDAERAPDDAEVDFDQ